VGVPVTNAFKGDPGIDWQSEGMNGELALDTPSRSRRSGKNSPSSRVERTIDEKKDLESDKPLVQNAPTAKVFSRFKGSQWGILGSSRKTKNCPKLAIMLKKISTKA